MTAPDLTPEQDAVRRLLADARHDGTTPPEVVVRLDDALAALVSERVSERVSQRVSERGETAGAPHAPVVDLGARRRRVAGIGLLAAAAVVVAGVAIGQGLPQMSGSDDAGSTAGGDTTSAQERELDTQDDGAGAENDSGATELAPESLKSTLPSPAAGYPTLSSFAADLDDDLLDLRATDSPSRSQPGSADALLGCNLRGIGQGRRLAAEVDAQAGVVVFRRPSGDVQDVALYVCGDPEPVRTLTLPAP